MISSKYNWVANVEGCPNMALQAFALGKLNTKEIPGAKSNPVIMALAAEAGVSSIYGSDEVPWCAIAQTVVALRAGKVVPFIGYDRLRAKSFERFGKVVTVPVMGDTLVFKRDGGYHVGTYFAEDSSHFHVAGGNQSNEFNVIRIEKSRLHVATRPLYKVMPLGAKRFFVEASGAVSKNEA